MLPSYHAVKQGIDARKGTFMLFWWIPAQAYVQVEFFMWIIGWAALV
jgi:hypothetical protein